MVSIRKAKQGFHLRNRRGHLSQSEKERMGLIAGGMCIGVLLVILWNSMSDDVATGSASSSWANPKEDFLRNRQDNPHLVGEEESHEKSPLPDRLNAVAKEIRKILDCDSLLNETNFRNADGWGKPFQDDDIGADPADWQEEAHRRLLSGGQHGDDGGFDVNRFVGRAENAKQEAELENDDEEEEKWGRGALGDIGGGQWDDPGAGGGAYQDDEFSGGTVDVTAKHLFCLAATANPPESIVNAVSCDATRTKRQTLLELWSAAESQMPKDLFLKTLNLGHEQETQQILGFSYNLWAPDFDDGFSYMVNTMNSEEEGENGGIDKLHESLGPGKVFVDVGGYFGLSTLTVANLYPGTKIVSIEPAPPSWLYQELNLRCNLSHDTFRSIKVIMAGVGPNSEEEETLTGKLMWRPSRTTSTRAWSPAEETTDQDIEVIVAMKRFDTILAEARIPFDESHPIDVLNVDCQGCEYNLLPSLADEEFDSISVILGRVHWGYIPASKLPSSKRGQRTHSRMCQHENIAKSTKECCAFPDLIVKSNIPGQVLYRDNQKMQGSTVSDIVHDGLCLNFQDWADSKSLDSVPNDFGWFDLTSQA